MNLLIRTAATNNVAIPTEAMYAHVWMVILSVLMASLATVNYNYKLLMCYSIEFSKYVFLSNG